MLFRPLFLPPLFTVSRLQLRHSAVPGALGGHGRGLWSTLPPTSRPRWLPAGAGLGFLIRVCQSCWDHGDLVTAHLLCPEAQRELPGQGGGCQGRHPPRPWPPLPSPALITCLWLSPGKEKTPQPLLRSSQGCTVPVVIFHCKQRSADEEAKQRGDTGTRGLLEHSWVPSHRMVVWRQRRQGARTSARAPS